MIWHCVSQKIETILWLDSGGVNPNYVIFIQSENCLYFHSTVFSKTTEVNRDQLSNVKNNNNNDRTSTHSPSEVGAQNQMLVQAPHALFIWISTALLNPSMESRCIRNTSEDYRLCGTCTCLWAPAPTSGAWIWTQLSYLWRFTLKRNGQMMYLGQFCMAWLSNTLITPEEQGYT